MQIAFHLTLATFALAALNLCRSTANAQAVEIPDTGLRDAIRAALGKPTGDITVADMEGLTTLDASLSGRGFEAPLITSLEGLQAAANLSRLNLRGEWGDWRGYLSNLGSQDLSPLEGLAHLSELDLSYNRSLSQLTLPAGLTALGSVDLSFNPLGTLVLPEFAAGAVIRAVEQLRNRGVEVYLYPREARLAGGAVSVTGTFDFTLTGPPGTYQVQATSDFLTLTDLGSVLNTVGSAASTDAAAGRRSQAFYRAVWVP